MDLANLFDSITIINTVHRTDRREEMRCMFTGLAGNLTARK